MRGKKRPLQWLLSLALILAPGLTRAEPMFISRQYTRCTTCHYSPTGGGLLTPYGRSLSRQELSTTGMSSEGPTAQGKEEQFLFGLLGEDLKPVDLGVDLRPAYLALNIGGLTSNVNMLMDADLMAAYRTNGWTFYGEFGREPGTPGSQTAAKFSSLEYWVGRESDSGLGFRVGRFLPAYGVAFADHTDYTRTGLGFDVFDQVFAVEISQKTEGHLLQVSVGPGYADSLIHGDGRGAFTATCRYQMDLSPRTALVFSGLYRDKSTLLPRNGAAGVALGFSPTSRLSLWTEADAEAQQSSAGTLAYTLLGEASYEVRRGLWLKFSPQMRTNYGQPSQGSWRTVLEADLLPRTHFNVDLSYYRDEDRQTGLVSKTFLAQLHIYL